DEGALEVGAEVLDGLDLEARGDQLGLYVAAGLGGRQVDVLPQPGKRDPHQISIPNGRVNRTSPSTMSRMSSTLWRNIRIRPKAKPLYFSGSTPQAVSTRGLTMPQPPSSIQPSLEQVRQGRSGLPTDSPLQT